MFLPFLILRIDNHFSLFPFFSLLTRAGALEEQEPSLSCFALFAAPPNKKMHAMKQIFVWVNG
jgi:hypothetical protein